MNVFLVNPRLNHGTVSGAGYGPKGLAVWALGEYNLPAGALQIGHLAKVTSGSWRSQPRVNGTKISRIWMAFASKRLYDSAQGVVGV